MHRAPRRTRREGRRGRLCWPRLDEWRIWNTGVRPNVVPVVQTTGVIRASDRFLVTLIRSRGASLLAVNRCRGAAGPRASRGPAALKVMDQAQSTRVSGVYAGPPLVLVLSLNSA